MKFNKRKLLLTIIFIILNFTACQKERINNDFISYNYEKEIQEITVINNSDNILHVSFNILLLNKDGEVLYKEKYEEKKFQKKEKLSVDLEDISPDYIEYRKVESMEVEVLEVFGESKVTIFIECFDCILIFIAAIFALISFFKDCNDSIRFKHIK